MIYNLKSINIKFFLLSFIVFTIIQESLIQNACGMEDSNECSLLYKKEGRGLDSPYRAPKKRRISSPMTSPRRLPEEGKENFCPNSPYKTSERKKENTHSTISPPATPEGKLEISEKTLLEFLSDDEATIISPEEKMEDENFTIPALKKRNSTKRIDFETITPPISSKDFSKDEPNEILPAAAKSIVWPENVTDLQKLTMRIVQKAFFRPIFSEGSPKGRHESNPLEVNLELVTPEKMTAYKALGGKIPPLRENIKSVRGEYSPIRNKELFPETTPQTFSPVAIEVIRNRRTIQEARETGAVISLPSIAHLAPYIPETPAERLLRKERQRLDFEAVASMNGHTPEDLKNEIADVVDMFKGYFNYIAYRKKEWQEGRGTKLRWYDKIDAFDKFVVGQRGIIRIECEGYEVFAFSQTIDLGRENILTGELNHEAMRNGYCPIGADGQKMEYHHLTRIDAKTHLHYGNSDFADRNPFRIVLIPGSIHTSYSGIWHLSKKFYQDLPKKSILRGEFEEARGKMNQAILAYMLGIPPSLNLD